MLFVYVCTIMYMCVMCICVYPSELLSTLRVVCIICLYNYVYVCYVLFVCLCVPE